MVAGQGWRVASAGLSLAAAGGALNWSGMQFLRQKKREGLAVNTFAHGVVRVFDLSITGSQCLFSCFLAQYRVKITPLPTFLLSLNAEVSECLRQTLLKASLQKLSFPLRFKVSLRTMTSCV
jgi:hypothetical protein